MASDKTGLDTFPKLLLHNGRVRGDLPAIREKNRGIWRTTTWRELSEEVKAVAMALSARGLQRGGHVALLGDNRPRLYVAMCAAQWLGAVAVPLYQDATAEELALLMQRADITHVFAENQEQVDKLLDILPRCPTVRCIVYDKDRGMRHYKLSHVVSYAALLQQGRELLPSGGGLLESEAARGMGDDSAFLFFTSGTTGPAKGVMLSHGSLIDRARVAAAADGLTDSDLAMAYLPPGWIGQCLFGYVQPMVVGYCICCPESSDTMLADMREVGPTCFLTTPRVLEALLTQLFVRVEEAGGLNRALYRRGMAAAQRNAARRMAGEPVPAGARLAAAAWNVVLYGPLRDMLGMSRMRVAYTAGDTISPELLTFFRALGINLKQLYGSTETGFFVAMQRDGHVKPDTVGQVADGVEVRFTEEREILVRSPGLFKEYYRDPEATQQARTGDGWFRTGDAGYIDADGHLRIVDRLKNLGVLKDGTPVPLRSIESKLKFLPYIKEAVAFGDGRDAVCVLVDIDPVAVGRWADSRTISYTGHADLASRDEVYGLIADCIASVNARLTPDLVRSKVHRFAILQTELSADDGALTRTGKLRRSAVADAYGALVEAMYQGRAEMRVGTADLDSGSADIKIRDAERSAKQARNAA